MGNVVKMPENLKPRVPRSRRPLGKFGRQVWRQTWDSMPWLNTQRDCDAVTLLCEDIDERQELRDILAQSDPEQPDWRTRTALRQLDTQIDRRMAALGMTPVARRVLDSTGEAKTGKLAQLRAKHS